MLVSDIKSKFTFENFLQFRQNSKRNARPILMGLKFSKILTSELSDFSVSYLGLSKFSDNFLEFTRSELLCIYAYYITNSYRPGIKKFDLLKAGL